MPVGIGADTVGTMAHRISDIAALDTVILASETAVAAQDQHSRNAPWV